MKKDNKNYFMVGLFVLSGIILFLFLLAKISVSSSSSDEYFVEFENVTGIKDGVLVTYNGYQIGSVSNVEPVVVNGKVTYRLKLLVKSGWKIPIDSRAQIVMPAIISDKQIDIIQGVATESLKPGENIKTIESVDIMQLVDSIAKELNQFIPESTQNVEELLGKLNASADQVSLLLSPDNVENLSRLFAHAETSANSLSQLAAGFESMSQQLGDILNKTELMVDDNSGDIRYTILEMKKSVDAVSGRIESIMYNLDHTSQNMNELSRTLRNNPAAVLGSKPPEDKVQ